MNYLSVCSGIEAASTAWEPLGWTPYAFSEIEKFPSAVLAHHWPQVPNFGDMTNFKEWPNANVDILVGGTPCQSFSVAGLRKGLDDPRGNLMLTYGAIAAKYRPQWLVWENVPGVLSSNRGRDFGTFLGMLGELGYGFAYRTLDAQYFGLAQRRKRVFVVAYLGDWRRAAAVLFERESLSGDTAPSIEQEKEPAPSASRGIEEGSGRNELTVGALDTEFGFQRRTHQTINSGHILPVMGTITARMFNALGSRDVEEGAVIPCELHKPIAFDVYNQKSTGDVSKPLAARSDQDNASVMIDSVGVRKLTPIECERLQGFLDNHTKIPYRNKPIGNCPDGPRYKAIGNSMAVPCMRWIGSRIGIVEAMADQWSNS